MKLVTLLLACTMLCAIPSNAQERKDTITLKDLPIDVPLSTSWGTGFSDSTVSLTKWDDGRIEIQGDTLKAIRLLFKKLDEANKREFDLWGFVGPAVAFTNNIPDYWKTSKNNKAWSKYYVQLKKLGFKIVRK